MGRYLGLAVLLASACGDDGASVDGGVDAPMVDSGSSDAATDGGTVDPRCVTGEDRPGPFEPDSYCPGAAGCMDVGDDVLHAGAAAVPITPAFGPDTETMTVDVDGDGTYEPLDGDQFEDLNGNRRFDAIWIGGFGNGRPASGINDEQWARVLALRRNDVTIVIGAVDTPILFVDEVDGIRDMVADLDIDYVAIASTHCHMCRDNIGFWGVEAAVSGRDDAYNAFLREQTAAAIREAVEALAPARIQYASFQLRDQPGGTYRYVSDSRDPVIIDDRVRLVRLLDASDGTTTIGTLVNWGSHAQYMGDQNTLLSSDFPHYLRDGIENGVEASDGTPVAGIGGVTVFVSGSAGTQVGNERMNARTWAGEDLPREGLLTAETVGRQVAWFTLTALGPAGGSVTDETAALGFRNRTYLVDVENRVFHTGFLNDLFDRVACNWDPDLPVVVGENEPDIPSEVAVIDIGRVQIITIPGELTPELGVGGYDGAFTPAGVPIVDSSRENPPDLSAAPAGPYLVDLARVDAEYVHFATLTLDYTGYFVPEFDFELHPSNAYFDEAPGRHYEETRSVGPDGWPEVRRHITDLLAWSPP